MNRVDLRWHDIKIRRKTGHKTIRSQRKRRMRKEFETRAPVITQRLSGPPPETGNFSGRLLHAMVPLSRGRSLPTTIAVPLQPPMLPMFVLAYATPPRRSAIVTALRVCL